MKAEPLFTAGAPPQTGGVLGHPTVHESARLHVTGSAPYTDDLAELAGTLHAALGLSPVARGRLRGIDAAALLACPGVVAILTAADIPGPNDCGPIVHDDPILAPLDTGGEPTLRYRGQPVFAVLAETREDARRAAAKAREVLAVEPLEAVVEARRAHASGRHLGAPMHLARGDAQAAIRSAPHRLSGSFSLGGQEQFYLEGQIAYAQPQEHGGMRVLCSTQHPSEMQHLVAQALGVASHAVQVECRRMGGGFGGKESQSALFACVAAVAARKTGRPVKLRLDRDDDFLITGRRHPFEFSWEVGFDAAGRVLGVVAELVANAGHSTDLSPPVMTRALCHFDNAYWLPNVDLTGYLARTDTQSNTAFRGFGGPQGALGIELILDDVARHLGLDALSVRRVNYYGMAPCDVTPYGQRVEDNILAPLSEALLASCDWAARRAAVDAFNARSPVIKRGLAFNPVKFGISFNVAHFNQAGALVHVYTDGSVLVNHGGTEMGQGLNTKVAQVVAAVLGLEVDRVRVTATDTTKVANTSATAASTGSDLNGKAAEDAARRIRARLAAWFAQTHGGSPDELRFEGGCLVAGSRRLSFEDAVRAAYVARVPLWSEGFYATPGLHWDRERLQGRPFHYFAYGAAVSEVELDSLTGESRLVRVDLLHDVGRSLNPAIDRGQIEGAFIQGMGWLTTEELWWQPMDGSRQAGLLMTHAPSTYKIPTAHDALAEWHVALWQDGQAGHPADTIGNSKAVGEPPLLLAISVFLALRDAVAACGPPRSLPPLRAPATPEALLDAVTALREARTATP